MKPILSIAILAWGLSCFAVTRDFRCRAVPILPANSVRLVSGIPYSLAQLSWEQKVSLFLGLMETRTKFTAREFSPDGGLLHEESGTLRWVGTGIGHGTLGNADILVPVFDNYYYTPIYRRGDIYLEILGGDPQEISLRAAAEVFNRRVVRISEKER